MHFELTDARRGAPGITAECSVKGGGVAATEEEVVVVVVVAP